MTKKDIESGREIQLFLYMKYVEERLGLHVAGVEIYPVKQRKRIGVYDKKSIEQCFLPGCKIRSRNVFTEKELDMIKKRSFDFIVKNIEGILSGEMHVSPHHCDFCKMNTICRFEKWRLKMRHGAEDETI